MSNNIRSILGQDQVPTNLLLWKMCWKRLNYTEETCDHMFDDGYEEVLKEAQVSTEELDRDCNSDFHSRDPRLRLMNSILFEVG